MVVARAGSPVVLCDAVDGDDSNSTVPRVRWRWLGSGDAATAGQGAHGGGHGGGNADGGGGGGGDGDDEGGSSSTRRLTLQRAGDRLVVSRWHVGSRQPASVCSCEKVRVCGKNHWLAGRSGGVRVWRRATRWRASATAHARPPSAYLSGHRPRDWAGDGGRALWRPPDHVI